MLEELGESLQINEIIYAKVTLFVIRYIYNDKKSKSLAESRSLIWKRMKKKSTRRLPPDEDTMRLHILRCNYAIFMNLNYMSAVALEPPGAHGWISQDGVFLPRRYLMPPLPMSMSVTPNTANVNDDLNKEDGEELDEEDEDAAELDDIIRDSDADEDSETDEDLFDD